MVPTGKDGRVLKEDIVQFLAQRSSVKGSCQCVCLYCTRSVAAMNVRNELTTRQLHGMNIDC